MTCVPEEEAVTRILMSVENAGRCRSGCGRRG